MNEKFLNMTFAPFHFQRLNILDKRAPPSVISDYQHVFLSERIVSALVLTSVATVRGGHVQKPHLCKWFKHFSVVNRSNGNWSASILGRCKFNEQVRDSRRSC